MLKRIEYQKIKEFRRSNSSLFSLRLTQSSDRADNERECARNFIDVGAKHSGDN